jgi:hypothetical protein
MGCVEHDQAITQTQYAEGKYRFPDWLRVADVKRYAHMQSRAIDAFSGPGDGDDDLTP